MSSNHGVQNAQIAKRIFRLELKVRSQDLTGGVILKTDQRELRATAFEPIVTAGVGEHHHAQAWTGRPARAISARPALLRRRQFCSSQDATHRFAADRQLLLIMKFFRQVRIVEALIFAAGQAQDQLLLGNGNGPRHSTSAIAMLYPADGIGLIPAFKALHLTFTQLQQPGGFAYAQPPARRVLNYFHPLKLFLTHCHHPHRVTKSRCS